MTSDSAAIAANYTGSYAPVRVLARVGWAVNGLMHVLIGAITLAIAAGAGADQSPATGALGAIAATPVGYALIWSVVVGFAALGVWRIVLAFLLPPIPPQATWVYRTGELSSAVGCFLVATIALTFVNFGSATAQGSASVEPNRTLGARLLALPGGVDLLTLGGLVVIIVGTGFIVSGAGRRFVNGLSLPSSGAGETCVVIGVTGYIAKGAVLCIAGILFVIASLAGINVKTAGLDGAVEHFVQFPLGAVLVGAIGAGLICYAAFCGVKARFSRF